MDSENSLMPFCVSRRTGWKGICNFYSFFSFFFIHPSTHTYSVEAAKDEQLRARTVELEGEMREILTEKMLLEKQLSKAESFKDYVNAWSDISSSKFK